MIIRVMAIIIMVMVIFVSPVGAMRLLFIPQDNRPVSLQYTVDTLRAVGIEVVVPPAELIAGRDDYAQPDKLWQWLMQEAVWVDAAVLSQDALVYGGLVASRRHELSGVVIEGRLANYIKFKQEYPALPLYVFATIMRSPQESDGGVEPDYYTEFGPDIFAYCALLDRNETVGLTVDEKKRLKELKAAIPAADLTDWLDRRRKNLAANKVLIDMTKQGVIDYFLLGRDDSWPYSQSGIEKRIMDNYAAGLTADKFITFNGADQLGLLLLTKAKNILGGQQPFVYAYTTAGAGMTTVPSYQDDPIGATIWGQTLAAGGYPVTDSNRADLILAVNTPVDGKTAEADEPENIAGNIKPELIVFVQSIRGYIAGSKPVSVADISYANGADNALMSLLAKEKMLNFLTAYNGWNTASNSCGYAMGQGILLRAGDDIINNQVKHDLLAVRYLDDWAYQANVRQIISRQVLKPFGGTYTNLGPDILEIENITKWTLDEFAIANFGDFLLPEYEVRYPWNRMFEVEIII